VNPEDFAACYAKHNRGLSALPAYRLYRLDGAGKITSGEWIAADADDEALHEARRLMDGASFELWERRRLVDRRANGAG